MERLARLISQKTGGVTRSLIAPSAPSSSIVECKKRGRQIKTATCGTCRGRVELKVFECSEYGSCTTLKPHADAGGCCAVCSKRRTDAPIHFDERNLWPRVPGKRFNSSVVEWLDGYAFCFRNGWKGSDLYVGAMTEDFEPIGEPTKLDLPHRECNYGREDPRLFVHDGQLHVAFAGVVGGSRIRHTSVLVARLGAGFKVAAVQYPYLEGRNLWEKNWSCFSHAGKIHAVYSIDPHTVLTIEDGKAVKTYEESANFPWRGGVRRGGASPVLVGDEYWHFFHDRIEEGGLLVYRTGLYVFEAKPPFRPTRYIPAPILTADKKTKPNDQYAAVQFVCGAVRDGDTWYLSHGTHDRWTEIHSFSHAELERRLVPVTPRVSEIPTLRQPAVIRKAEFGVAIGSYMWPDLVELQIKLIRDTCGPVPILVSSDHPESDSRIEVVCSKYPDVTFWPNGRRIGHTGGDLAVYYKAVKWGADRGLKAVAKLSQRMLITKREWLQEIGEALLASGSALSVRRTEEGSIGLPAFPLRSEAVVLDVAQWNRPDVLERIAPEEQHHRREGGLCVEMILEELVRDVFGDLYWPWALFPTDRRKRGDGFVWHDCDNRTPYDALAEKHLGRPLPKDFTASGWAWQLDKGEYLFG